MSIELADIVAKLRERSQADLSEREMAALRLIAKGFISKQIAFELRISERTLECDRTRIMRSLKAKTPAHAVYIACQRGLI